MKPQKCPQLALIATLFASAVSLAVAAENWGDQPLKVIQSLDSDYPPALAMRGITSGEVRAVLNVDADGRLADCLVLAYSEPEFARDLLATLREWKFEAARKHGEPIGVRAEAVFSYSARGQVLSLTTAEATTAAMNRWIERDLISLTCKADELDRPLATVQVVAPVHPGPSLQPAIPTGKVTLDFFVDAEGRPRMPVVVSATHDAFAFAAVDALEKWRFTPPTHDGKPVAVRVKQEFVFATRT